MVWTKIKSGEKADVVVMTLSEVAANDSSKELTITDIGSAGYFELMGVRIEFAATSTVGTREIAFQILDSSDDVLHEIAINANTVVADATGTWELHANAPTAVTTPQYVHMPYGLYIYPDQKLLIEDSAAIDAAADDMVLHVTGKAHYAKAV